MERWVERVAGEDRVGRRALGEFARRTAVGGGAVGDMGGPPSAGAGFCGGCCCWGAGCGG
jgi:hypothetical protein